MLADETEGVRYGDQPWLRGRALREARIRGLQRNHPGDGDLHPPLGAPAARAGYLRQVGEQVRTASRVRLAAVSPSGLDARELSRRTQA